MATIGLRASHRLTRVAHASWINAEVYQRPADDVRAPVGERALPREVRLDLHSSRRRVQLGFGFERLRRAAAFRVSGDHSISSHFQSL